MQYSWTTSLLPENKLTDPSTGLANFPAKTALGMIDNLVH